MKFKQIHTVIPDTPSAVDALNESIQKIYKAHGAQGEAYFETETIEASKKATKKPKPAAKKKPEPDDTVSNEGSTDNKTVEPAENGQADK